MRRGTSACTPPARHSYAFSAGFFLGPLVGGLLMPLGRYPLMFATLTVVMLGRDRLSRRIAPAHRRRLKRPARDANAIHLANRP